MFKVFKTLVMVVILALPALANGQDLLNTPECVNFDSVYNRYLVSNFSSGEIIQIDMDGNHDPFRSGLGNAFSNHVTDSLIYITDGNRLYGFGLDSAQTIFGISITGSYQLDGLTTDTSGYLYICDYNWSGSDDDNIVKVDLSDLTHTILATEAEGLAPGPQDVIFDAANNQLIVVGYSVNAPIQAVSLPDGTVTNLIETTYDFDGIAYDNYGNFYVSTWDMGAIYTFDTSFTGPLELLSSGHGSAANLGYNRRDDILAIPDYYGDRIDFLNMRVNFNLDTTFGQVPLEVNFDAYSLLDMDIISWSWSFSDGGSASGRSPSYTFTTPGVFDATVSIELGDTTYSFTKTDCIYALADSLTVPDIQGDPGSTIEIVINAKNSVPLRGLRIPVEYAGLLNIALDSFSTAGCRTDHFDNKVQSDSDPIHWETAFRLYNDVAGNTPEMEPGYGPVLKLYFTIPSSAVFGRTSTIILDGYASNLPEMEGASIEYTPVCGEGLVSIPGICGDANDDGNVNILDITFLIGYKYLSGPEPSNLDVADVNNDGNVNILDITYLISYKYLSGPEPNCG